MRGGCLRGWIGSSREVNRMLAEIAGIGIVGIIVVVLVIAGIFYFLRRA